MDDYKFKIKGKDELMTYPQLLIVGKRTQPRCVKIIDVKSKKTWVADYLTIVRKFG